MALPPTSWCLLMPSGELVIGGGDGPNGNVCGLAREAIAAMFSFPKLPPLIVVGSAAIKCAADFAMGEGVKQRVWSFGELATDGRRLFVWSGGELLGIGRTQEEVGSAVQAFRASSGRGRAHAGDILRLSR